MTIRSMALFFHLLGMLTLFGSLLAEWLSLESLRRSEGEILPPFSLSILTALPRFTPIAGVLILASGGYLAARAGVWEFAWLRVSVTALVLMGILGEVALRPVRRALRQSSSSQRDAPIPGVRQLAFHPFLRLSLRTRTAVALGIVYLMIAKPDLFQSVALIGTALVLGAAPGLFARSQWRQPRPGLLEESTRRSH